jgi:hypothetical protein
MGDLKPFQLVPNPSGDRKVWEFELTLLESFELNLENLSDKLGTIQFLARAALKGEPVDRKLLQGLLTACDTELSTIANGLMTAKQRKAQIQQHLTTRGDR